MWHIPPNARNPGKGVSANIERQIADRRAPAHSAISKFRSGPARTVRLLREQSRRLATGARPAFAQRHFNGNFANARARSHQSGHADTADFVHLLYRGGDSRFQMPVCLVSLQPSVAQSLRLFPEYNDPLSAWFDPLGDSSYNALQVKFTRRFTRGLDVQSSFSYQKELCIGCAGINDAFNRSENKSLNPSSTPFIWVTAFTYEDRQIRRKPPGAPGSWRLDVWGRAALCQRQPITPKRFDR